MSHAEKKAETHRKVLAEAAAAIRTLGPEGIGVASLMQRVGLTHGGFYAHFKSKDDLVAQAIAQMFVDSRELFVKRTAGREPKDALINYVDNYVSARHRDNPSRGCPLPSLSGEVGRLPDAARKRFGEGYTRLTGAIADLLAQLGRQDAEALAASALAEMVGAVALSRAIADPADSNKVLDVARHSVKARLGLLAA